MIGNVTQLQRPTLQLKFSEVKKSDRDDVIGLDVCGSGLVAKALAY